MNSGQKFKLKLLGSLGYFYFGFILLSLLGIIAAIIFSLFSAGIKGSTVRVLFRIGIPAIFLLVGLFKGFFQVAFSKLPEPDGIKLERKDAPYFYELLDDICKKSDSPEINCVKLDYTTNAYILEQPSLGMFGRYKRYLVIGLPLFLTLAEEELKAVIAHECGHLSKSHSKDSGKIYRAKLLWERISEELKKSSRDRVFFIRIFMHRYMPALNNMLYSMRKEHEYQADNIAASITGGEALASALLKMPVYNEHLERNLWDKIYKQNCEMKDPPDDIFFMMKKEAAAPVDPEMAEIVSEGLLKYESMPNSTHPSYSERIMALGLEKVEFNQTSDAALGKVFREKTEDILKALSTKWADDVREQWGSYFDGEIKRLERFKTLNDKYDKDELNIDETFERAFMIERTQGIEAAMECFNEIKERYPDEIYVEYNIGRLMLLQGDEEGKTILLKLMEEESSLIPDACSEIVNYYCYRGERDEAAEYYHAAVDFMKTNEDVANERDKLTLADYFIPHDLGYDTIMKLRQDLMNSSEVKRAYVVVKYTELSSQFPLYVIGIEYKSSSSAARDKVQQKLLEEKLLPWEYWIVSLNDNRELDYKMNMIPESRIV